MVAAVTGFPARSRRRRHGSPAASRRYERRRPENTPLHTIVSENLESWLAWRKAVTALASGHGNDGPGSRGCCDAHQKTRSPDTSRIAWAKLLARAGEEFPLECPNCGGDIRLIARIGLEMPVDMVAEVPLTGLAQVTPFGTIFRISERLIDRKR